MKPLFLFFISLFITSTASFSQVKQQNKNAYHFNFDGNAKSKSHEFKGSNYAFIKGIKGKALSIESNNNFNHLSIDALSLNGTKDFTVQFWVKTTSKNPMVLLSQKDFSNKGIYAQKNAGWALYSSGGTFAWTVGSGKRRLNYERDNGDKMPINDGKWHQITMSYNKQLTEFRLYYDGLNKAVYNVDFDFKNNTPLVIGGKKNSLDYQKNILPSIKEGAKQLQNLVDAFNKLAVENLKEDEFFNLIDDPKKLYLAKLSGSKKGEDKKVTILDPINKVRSKLYSNPYTVYQYKNLTKLKPISKLYSLKEDKVVINNFQAKKIGTKERLFPSDFSIDNLSIFNMVLSADEIFNSYKKLVKTSPVKLEEKVTSLTVAVWNIWHGGKHFTKENSNYDSRLRIVEMIKKSNVDVVLMQETYSSGDFIAAELGYYFATTSDWDYCHQGSNISVLSRYPIKELDVPNGAEFMNVSVKLAISKTQEIYAMSNWYGMSKFPLVYDYHKERIKNANTIPILFGGDFNAIPHTDGGKSPASKKMLENGFTDAYRSLHPDIKSFPGYTHEWGERIDQLYYKGKGLKNISSKVISTWFEGFPSDHYMILTKFQLKY